MVEKALKARPKHLPKVYNAKRNYMKISYK